MTWAIGIDIGTTNVKVALTAADGTPVGTAHRSLSTSRDGDVAEQDAEATWQRLVEAVRELTAAHPTEAAGVVAVGVCTQYSSVVPIDGDGLPLSPMLMWQDQRGTDHCFDIMGRDENAFMLWIERHGIPTIGSGLSLGHILYVQLDRPELHARTTAYVEAMDYITARCTGRITACQHSTYMFQCCDNRTLGATHVRRRSREAERRRCHSLAAVGADRIGDRSAAARSRVGVRIAGVGNGVRGHERHRHGRGRGRRVRTRPGGARDRNDERARRLGRRLPRRPRAPDLLDARALLGFLRRVRRERPRRQGARARARSGRLPQRRARRPPVDDAFARARRGTHGNATGRGRRVVPAVAQRLALAGRRRHMRGGFMHMSLDTNRRDIVRAVVEGIAHNLGWLLPHVETFTGEHIDDIVFVGGAARSRPWCAILADILDRPVAPLHTPDRAVARATALLALQRHGDITRELERARRDRAPLRADEHVARAVRDRQVQFEAAYAALLPISEALT